MQWHKTASISDLGIALLSIVNCLDGRSGSLGSSLGNGESLCQCSSRSGGRG